MGFDADTDDEYPNVLHLLEGLEIDEGLSELVASYKMILALNCSNATDKVKLDLRDFEPYYNNLRDIFEDVKRNFVDRVRMYDYLFNHTVDLEDKVLEVRNKLNQFNEDDLIDRVLPLLTTMKFQKVERIPHHGQNELGLDIRPFYDTDKIGRRIYYGAQVKAIDIHTNSRKEGNAVSINNQIELALNSDFLDTEDNEKKRIDRIYLITSGKINDGAREYFHKRIPNRTLALIDGNQLSNLIVEYELTDQILHTKKVERR